MNQPCPFKPAFGLSGEFPLLPDVPNPAPFSFGRLLERYGIYGHRQPREFSRASDSY